jgi:hypothetical protein
MAATSSFLRDLWRHRLLVSLVTVFALLAGLATVYRIELSVPPKFHSKQHTVGLASASVLLDTRESNIASLEGGDFATLSARAALLMRLLATPPVKATLAQRAGVVPQKLVITATAADGSVMASPALNGDPENTSNPKLSVLSLKLDPSLPIINVDAQAPGSAGASRLSEAAVSVLREQLQTLTTSEDTPLKSQLVAKALGASHADTERRGPRRLYGPMAFLVVLAMGSGAIVFTSRLARSWRESSLADDGLAGPAALDAWASMHQAEERIDLRRTPSA